MHDALLHLVTQFKPIKNDVAKKVDDVWRVHASCYKIFSFLFGVIYSFYPSNLCDHVFIVCNQDHILSTTFFPTFSLPESKCFRSFKCCRISVARNLFKLVTFSRQICSQSNLQSILKVNLHCYLK